MPGQCSASTNAKLSWFMSAGLPATGGRCQSYVATVLPACTPCVSRARQAQREALAFLKQLMDCWLSVLAERAAGDVLELTHGSSDALLLDMHRLEACSLVCLAGHDEVVRREALQVRARPVRSIRACAYLLGVRGPKVGRYMSALRMPRCQVVAWDSAAA